MRSVALLLSAAFTVCVMPTPAQTGGPYKVVTSARVGGEGGWDYIYADTEGRRLYIPRGATRAVAATDSTPEVAAVPARLIRAQGESK